MKLAEKLRHKLEMFLELNLGGHISIGSVTVFGFNEMHVAVEVYTDRFGYIVFHPSLGKLGDLISWHIGSNCPAEFYISPNATPWASTFLLGKGATKDDKVAALRRWILWGHNYDCQDPHKEQEFWDEYVFTWDNEVA
jgi:hypothetical protein